MAGNNKNQEDGFAQVNGINLHYISQGEGKLALLLHGFPEYWYSWRHQLPFLADKFKTVAPDLRGYNLSDKPKGIKAYHMDTLIGDIKGLIKFFDSEKAIIIAHDWGGVIAWDLAAFYPEVVERLVIMNAPHPKAFMREIRTNRNQLKSSWYIFMFQLPFLPEWYIYRNNYKMIENIFAGWVNRKDTFSKKDIDQFKKAMAQPGSLTATINYYRAIFKNSRGRKEIKGYPKIEVPTMIIWGEDDRALTKELTYNLDRYFEAPLEIKYIPDCSHWVQQEQPDIVNGYLKDFLF